MKTWWHSVRRALFLSIALLILSGGLASCKASEDPGERELGIYLLACPTGPFVCYDNCFTSNDSNGNGIIEGSETFGLNICNQQCASQCSLAWLFFALVDE